MADETERRLDPRRSSGTARECDPERRRRKESDGERKEGGSDTSRPAHFTFEKRYPSANAYVVASNAQNDVNTTPMQSRITPNWPMNPAMK